MLNNSSIIIGAGNFGTIIKMDPSFVKCDKVKIGGYDWFELLEREFLLKIIPRGEGNSNVSNEVAVLDSLPDYYNNGAIAAWMSTFHYFILLYRKQMDVRQFIQKVKQYCTKENKHYQLSNTILKKFTWDMIYQLRD